MDIVVFITIILAYLITIAGFLSVYDVIKIRRYRRLKIGFIFLGSVFFCLLMLIYTGSLFTDSRIIMYLPAVFALASFVGFYYDRKAGIDDSKLIAVSLKADEYEYVTQETIATGNVPLSIGQDFAYVNNYLYVPGQKIYILLLNRALTEGHDLKIEMNPVPKYGDNVFECVDLVIADDRPLSEEEIFYKAIKWLMITFAVTGSVPFAWLIASEGNVPSFLHELGNYCLLGTFGCGCISLSLLTESKFSKALCIIFGGFILLIIFLNVIKSLVLLI